MIAIVREIIQRLSDGGWSPIFAKFGINPASETLHDDLIKPVGLSPNQIAMIPGFGDISPLAKQAIEPGSPARSILFHALSSPNVTTTPDGTPLAAFPTAADLDQMENVVFGLVPPTFEALAARFGNTANLAAVVFAREYRQAAKTVHGDHADLVFSRTGITRVGTEEAVWDGKTRSYLPREEDDDPFAFRVLPCRYGVYLAVQLKGKKDDFGPFKFNRAFELNGQEANEPDDQLDFWVPVHKLFDGSDCLLGLTLDVQLDAHHINEKLRRIHVNNLGERGLGGFDTGFKSPATDVAPFLVTSGLASFLNQNVHGSGTLAATVRPRVIEPTELNGQQIGTKIPARRHGGLSPSFFTPGGQRGAHPSPEWMHVRSRLKRDGTIDNLNLREDVADVVRSASVAGVRNFTAGHYTDFTGDGWIDAKVGGLLGSRLDRMVPAYSVIAAPDFYPYVDQSVLLDWWRTQVPTNLRSEMWNRLPLALCDQRSAANITLREFGGDIRPENKTPTAIVGLKGSANAGSSRGSELEIQRVSALPDAGAGVYQPGWDVSTDVTRVDEHNEDVLHLAAYGLGSPFPEDAKLCAALSAFWPGVAPDSARSSGQRPIAPMTDREVGLDGAPAWDGVPGPRRHVDGSNREFVETDNFDHVDYVQNALDGRFTMVETMKVSQQDYQGRVLATARMRQFLRASNNQRPGDPLNLGAVRILSFNQGRQSNATVASAESALGIQFDAGVCQFGLAEVMAANRPVRAAPGSPRWLRREEITEEVDVIIGSDGLTAFRFKGRNWEPAEPLVG
ncbi:hypothetical protein J7413_19395 [Shimia sp. R10_1]|uniref:hypothetical protein n=1 Tax=Shimia sp. R10_1 TaxID=2821095 RepID=UPI001ADA7325|nr:hypothetical protein [Shimia sp. R10_1]MBO9475710.1 hypothetical protein [Shimia sp. R10_1]